MNYWVGLAGPFTTLAEAEQFATVSGTDVSSVYVCDDNGNVLV